MGILCQNKGENMDKILDTLKLKEVIENDYVKKLGKILERNVDMPNIHFAVGTDSSAEGTYVFSDEKGYNYMFTEKGKIRKHEITNDVSKITYWVMNDVVFAFALEYATEFREAGQDFRRKLFQREKEIWEKLDEVVYARKCEEIKKTLEENPYMDNLN